MPRLNNRKNQDVTRFGCGAHRDAIAYVMRADDLDFAEAAERLADEAALQVPHDLCP